MKLTRPEHAHLIPKNPKDITYKNKCIVVLFGKNKGRRYKADGSFEEFEDEKTYMPFVVGDLDDMKHIEIVRRTKGYGVSGVELLGNIENPKVREAIANEIHLLTHAPEVSESLALKDAEIAELKARLDKVQAEKTPEKRVEILGETVAALNSRPKREKAPDQ